VKNDL